MKQSRIGVDILNSNPLFFIYFSRSARKKLSLIFTQVKVLVPLKSYERHASESGYYGASSSKWSPSMRSWKLCLLFRSTVVSIRYLIGCEDWTQMRIRLGLYPLGLCITVPRLMLNCSWTTGSSWIGVEMQKTFRSCSIAYWRRRVASNFTIRQFMRIYRRIATYLGTSGKQLWEVIISIILGLMLLSFLPLFFSFLLSFKLYALYQPCDLCLSEWNVLRKIHFVS